PFEVTTSNTIAFMSDRDGTFDIFDIYVMNADGTGQTRLTDNLAWDESPSWSPDGNSGCLQRRPV
ncbi:MAG TPA: translocation protein TolB, partial [Candidatus Latescibacteria bacterium]|nr:translocation protein TolB [Candidatus Latescibacterota bacterium]